jgi:hypothetical protein
VAIVEIDDVQAKIIVIGVVPVIDCAEAVFFQPDTCGVGRIECLRRIARALETETFPLQVCPLSEISVRSLIVQVLQVIDLGFCAWALEKLVFRYEPRERAEITERFLRVARER